MTENEHFTANEVDEQVDSYLTIDDTSTSTTSAKQTIKALQRHYAPTRDYSQSLERVWGRFVQQSNSLQSTSLKTTGSQQRPISQQQTKRFGMKPTLGLPRHEGPAARRLSLIAAVVFAVLLIGSMLALFQQRSSTGTPPESEIYLPRIYAETSSGIYCLDPNTYKTLWHFSMPQVTKKDGTQGPIKVQVEKGILYVLGLNSDGYYLYALNTSDGSMHGHFKVPGMTGNGKEITTLANGVLYLNQDSPKEDYSLITAIDASSGKQLWQHRYERAPATSQKTTEPNMHFVTSVRLQAVTSNMLYATNYTWQDSNLVSWTRYALSPKDGSIIWQYSTQAAESPLGFAADDSNIYIVTTSDDPNIPSDHLYAYDAKQGTKKWSFSLGTYNSIGNPTALNGVIYFRTVQVDPKTHQFSPNATIYALRAKDGLELWHYTAPEKTPFFMRVRDKTVYIISSQQGKGEQDIIAIDATTGKTRWSHPIPVDFDRLLFTPIIGKDFIYLTGEGNKVAVLHASDGSFVTTFTVEKPSSSFSSTGLIVP